MRGTLAPARSCCRGRRTSRLSKPGNRRSASAAERRRHNHGRAHARHRDPRWTGGHAESRHLDALLALADNPRVESAFARGDGLCVPHLTRLVGHTAGTPGMDAAERVVGLATARWRRLEAALDRFIA